MLAKPQLLATSDILGNLHSRQGRINICTNVSSASPETLEYCAMEFEVSYTLDNEQQFWDGV